MKILSLLYKKIEQEKPDLSNREIVDTDWYQQACKHYCGLCERWFSDVRGTLMHNRHKHSDK